MQEGVAVGQTLLQEALSLSCSAVPRLDIARDLPHLKSDPLAPTHAERGSCVLAQEPRS